jgi:hypothetical protein
MKILVATALIEGELVWMQDPCATDRDDPDGPCGCVRGVTSGHHDCDGR